MSWTASETMKLATSYIGYPPKIFYDYYSDHVTAFHSGDWCACFVSCILLMSGNTCAGFPSLYCPTARNAGVKAGKNVSVYNAKPGDVIFFNWDNNQNADHVGICESVNVTKRTITTIDGNVSNRVGRRTRSFSEVMTVVRPNYPAEYYKSEVNLMNLVKCIQRFLQSKGYYQNCLIDGDMGPLTVKALQHYLTKIGCYNRAIDGNFGAYTKEALDKALSTGKFC